VVDDSNLLRGILREELEAEGYKVLLAEDGERAVEMARDHRPDIVLLDVMLPDIDGYEVCRRMKGDTSTADIPVLILSSRNELKDKLEGYEAGADDYLTKPFFTKELLARLRTNLRVRDSLDSSRKLGQFYLEMLFGIGSAITSPFKVDDEVEIILRQALMAARAHRGAILLLDPEQGMLEVRSVCGYEGDGGPRPGQRFRISDKIPVLSGGAESDSVGIRVYGDSAKATAFVPMVAKERLIGGIEIALDGRQNHISANDQKLLYALASQGAIVIENARLERDVRSMFLGIIVAMANAVDAKDAYTHGHSLRVARASLLVAQQVGLARDKMETLLLSGILHDVGKIAIPDDILKKPGRLDREEFEIMRGHPVVGAKLLAHVPALELVIPGIRHHHEYWDGSGYPDGLRGEAIPLAGRIILMGDAFDAMTTDRVYRKGMPVAEALAEMRRFSGIQFCPELVDCIEEIFRQGKISDEISKTTPTIDELINHIR
jgi:response regulator RpfG family c-di-GMP phosphodiesterase